MKKILSTLSSALILLAALFSFNTVAKSASFTIGTGGPTGVYFKLVMRYVKCCTSQLSVKNMEEKRNGGQSLQMYSIFNWWIKL